ncbi:MAG: NUDIX hydrolase [Chloroflexota bacterium]|nr:NUDIX hydrolase [Chloroflexota bacterium]
MAQGNRGIPPQPEVRREYPAAPVVAVGAAVVREGKVLLVERRNPPAAGRWSLPGGVVRLGETLAGATRREMREECGLEVEIGGLLEVVERMVPDEAGRIRYHYIIVDFWAHAPQGEARASSDARAVRWVGEEELGELALTAGLEAVIRKALALAAPGAKAS